MKVRARFYAQLRDLTRAETVDVDLDENVTISDLLEELFQRFPTLRANDKSVLVGVGVEFVDRSYKLKAGEEIAIMPPVQGG